MEIIHTIFNVFYEARKILSLRQRKKTFKTTK